MESQRARRDFPGWLHWLARVSRRLLTYLLVLVVCAVTVFPIYWMAVGTLQPSRYSTVYPPALLPKEPSLSVLGKIFSNLPLATWILNSTILALLTTAICLGLAVLGAFALSALRWRGRSGFGFFLLITQMLPDALIIIPIFTLFRDFGLRNSLFGLSLINAAFAVPLGTWILKNLFDTIPREIYDAALVDGCARLGSLWHITLPLTTPGLVAVSVVAFIRAWNDYLFSATLINRASLMPATVGLATLPGMIDTPVDQILAAGMLFSVFPVVFYIIVQRYIVAGMTAGAVKG